MSRSCGYKTSQNHYPPVTVLDSCIETFELTRCVWFLTHLLLYIMTKHFHFGLRCSRSLIVCSDATLQTMFLLEKRFPFSTSAYSAQLDLTQFGFYGKIHNIHTKTWANYDNTREEIGILYLKHAMSKHPLTIFPWLSTAGNFSTRSLLAFRDICMYLKRAHNRKEFNSNTFGLLEILCLVEVRQPPI